MFNEFLTTEGERLLAKSIAGTATITFTKMELGDGDRGTASRNITSLESKRMTLDIYSVQVSGDNHITITSMLKSENIASGFYFREKAVYATDGTTEILFMYGTAGSLAEWIENNNISVFERTIRTIIALSDGDDINVTIQEGVYASGEEMKQTKTEILTAIQNIKLDGDWATQNQAESILSMLDTFVAAYTILRAGKLDNLDALVSSRAPANTALSNAVWTNGRAGLLDNLDAKISSRAPASTALSNGVWTDARAGSLDNLPTILSYAYSAMANIGSTADGGGGVNTGNVMAKLNVLLSRTLSGGVPGTVKSTQRGFFGDSAAVGTIEGRIFYQDVTISAVNMNKAVVLVHASNGNDSYASLSANARLINSTTLRLYATNNIFGNSGSVENVSWQVIDFY